MDAERQVMIVSHPEELARTGAQILLQAAVECVDKNGRFAVALSGGSTPRPMHRLLAEEPYLSRIPWKNTHVFWVDERMVPAHHPDSNYGLARKDLLQQVPLPVTHIHPMPTGVAPGSGAVLYAKELRDYFKPSANQNPVFDLICLGIGSDGHVASLFPGYPYKENPDIWVANVKGGSPNIERLTLTFSILNSADKLFFLVSGIEKAPIMRTLFRDKPSGLPAQKIRPRSNKLTWILDAAAASML